MVNTKLALLLVLLHAAFGSSYRWFNWQFEVTCESDAYIAPHNETAVANFLKQQYPKGSHIKVVGNGHGFGNLTTCVDNSLTKKPSYIVSMTNLKGLNIDKKNMTVTFGADWDVYNLTEELKANNLSFGNLSIERVQNFVGAASTSTHGSRSVIGNIASQIIRLRVLNAQGNLRVINKTNNPEELKTFRISLGALGLITEMTIKVQPTLLLKKTTKIVNATSDYTLIGKQLAQLYKDHDRNEASQNWDLEPTYFYSYWEPTNYTGVHNCTLNYCANDCGDCKKEYICYDEVIDAASCPPQGVCDREFYAEIEHFLPIEYYAEAAADYISYQQSQTPRMKAPYNSMMVIQHRSLKGDDAYMSPVNTYNLGSDLSGVFAIIEIDWIQTYNNFTTLWQNQQLGYEFMAEFGEKYNVRPHWNKMNPPNATYALEKFPKLPEFLAIQQRQDPKCQFVNEFLVEQLGITRCANYLSI
ncbi:gulonolactone oxidase [Aspergillus flavus]|nr:gulonolactone oxidase [Aspergillus flavus]